MTLTTPPPIENLFDPTIIDAVGTLFLSAASTETALAFELALLSAAPNQASHKHVILCNGMGLRVKLEKIKELTRIHRNIDQKKVDTLCDKIDDIYGHRNNIAHNLSYASDNGIEITLFKIDRKSRKLPKKFYTAKQIKDYGISLGQHTLDLSLLLKSIQPERQLG